METSEINTSNASRRRTTWARCRKTALLAVILSSLFLFVFVSQHDVGRSGDLVAEIKDFLRHRPILSNPTNPDNEQGETEANDKRRGEELWWKEEGPSMSTKMSPRLWANDGFRIITDIIAIDVDMEEELLIIHDTAVTAQGESYVIFLSFSF